MEPAIETTPAGPLSFVGKMRVLLACVVAVLLIRTVGWNVARPTDPDLAVTLLVDGQNWLYAALIILLLAIVAAAVGIVIIGPRLPEGGIFAVGIGLTALAIRGGSMQMMLAYHTGAEPVARRALMIKMGLDCILWALIIAITWAAASLIRMWLWPAKQKDNQSPSKKIKHPDAKSKSTTNQAGWPALIVTTLVALFVIWLTIARTPVAQIARGQVIASVAGGLFLGALAARYFTNVNDSRWYALAVIAVAMLAYLLGFLNADLAWAKGKYQFFASMAITPPHALVRALPIEYLATGVSAVLAGYWCGEKMELVAENESSE